MKWLKEFIKGVKAYPPTPYNIGMLFSENFIYWVLMTVGLFIISVSIWLITKI